MVITYRWVLRVALETTCGTEACLNSRPASQRKQQQQQQQQREKFLQTAGSVLKHAMCSKREGSEALCGRNPAVLGHHSVAAHAA